MTQALNGVAPADSRPHRKWRWWEMTLAYFILAMIASASIWFVDREAMRVQIEQTGNTTSAQFH